MATGKRFLTYNILALICAIWFLLAGWIWIYWINVVFVFPFAIAGFFLWRRGVALKKVIESNCRLDALGGLLQLDWVSNCNIVKELRYRFPVNGSRR